MSELEERAFKIAFAFYSKWRETVIETDEQWLAWAQEWGAAFDPVFETPIGRQLALAIESAFCEMYKDGMKPVPADYFGRDDI